MQDRCLCSAAAALACQCQRLLQFPCTLPAADTCILAQLKLDMYRCSALQL